MDSYPGTSWWCSPPSSAPSCGRPRPTTSSCAAIDVPKGETSLFLARPSVRGPGSYPNLEAEPAFKELQEQLEQTETLLAQGAVPTTRRAGFNNSIQTMPGNIVAWAASMSALEDLGAEEKERALPTAELDIRPAATASV